MTNEERKAAYECSVLGYIKYFKDNNYTNAKDAIIGSIKYLLRIDVDESLTSCTRNELIYVMKNEVAKMVAREQLNNNPNDLTNMHNEEDKQEIQFFLNNPVGYIGNKLKEKAIFEKDAKDLEGTSWKLASKYNKNIRTMAPIFNTVGATTWYNAYQDKMNDKPNYFGILQLKSKLPNNSIEEAFERQKPSFFEKIFKTTSNEYNNFKLAFEEYNDEKSIYCGNDERLEEAAMGYIRHKFPNLNGDELPTPEQIAKLGGAGKERAQFCLNVVETIRENAKAQEQANKMMETVKNLKVDASDLNNDSNELQNNLKNEVKEEAIDINKNDIQINQDNIVEQEISNE